MKTSAYLAILCMVIAPTKSDYCQDDFKLSQLPGGILQEMVGIATKGIVEDFAGCPEDIPIRPDDVKLYLYTRNNQKNPQHVNSNQPKQIHPSKPTKILIPGWLCNMTNDRMPRLREAYFKHGDYNLIGIDWTALSIDLYSNAFCKVPKVAEVLGEYLCQLHEHAGFDLSQIHILGHSLGAHIAGLAGQKVKKRCQQTVGRITGLDPAGPLYYGISKTRRLDESDAIFVDVIHTNTLMLGYGFNCGTVDFYPNCADVLQIQPGCMELSDLTDLLNLPVATVACSHFRSVDYMAESINSDNFQADSSTLACVRDIFPKVAKMGENCPRDNLQQKYVLYTNGEPPYAQG